jgi:hypothetical protein
MEETKFVKFLEHPNRQCDLMKKNIKKLIFHMTIELPLGCILAYYVRSLYPMYGTHSTRFA